MSLISCPECANNCSSTADFCPSCGYKFNSNINLKQRTYDALENINDAITDSANQLIARIILTAVVTLCALYLGVILLGCSFLTLFFPSILYYAPLSDVNRLGISLLEFFVGTLAFIAYMKLRKIQRRLITKLERVHQEHS